MIKARKLLVLTLCLAGFAVAPSSHGAEDQANEQTALSRKIDERLSSYWQSKGITPAPAADDHAFLRRVSLDLAGATPRVSDLRRFVADDRPDKRRHEVDRLLASSRHAAHLANTWRDLLLPDGAVDFQRREQAIGLRNWLRDRFDSNLRFDNLVYDLLVATDAGDLGPAAYFAAHELKPEKLAANCSEQFLGVSLECAQCHDHPYTDWTQNDFWSFAAFFARVRPAGGDMMQPGMPATRLVDARSGEVYLPEDESQETPIAPRYLGGAEAEDSDVESRREQLALWMAQRSNEYLARSVVNSTWRRLFGVGLVEEINANGNHLPRDHAELLDLISEDFVRSGFDLRRLHRNLVLTEAYQRSAPAPGTEKPPLRSFAAARPRLISPEQLRSSVGRLVPRQSGVQDPFVPDPMREAFVARMQAPSESDLEFGGSTLQSLEMLHGATVQSASGAGFGGIVPAWRPWPASRATRSDSSSRRTSKSKGRGPTSMPHWAMSCGPCSTAPRWRSITDTFVRTPKCVTRLSA